MPGENLSPTRSNLRKTKKDLAFAKEGFSLLEQKREILIMEIMKRLSQIKIVENEFRTRIEEFYESYRETACLTDADSIVLNTSFEKKNYSIETKTDELMGIKIPEIKLDLFAVSPVKNLSGTHPSYDRSKKLFSSFIEESAKYSTLLKAVFLLSRELKKVQRRVNALEKIFIPEYIKDKKYITERLEEMEREELFIKKMIHENND